MLEQKKILPSQQLTANSRQQPFAALLHVVPGGLEIAGVPRIGHVARVVGVIHQQRYFIFNVVSDNALDVPPVVLVHDDDVVVIVVVGAGHLAGGLAVAGDAVRSQHPAGRRIDGVANLLAARRGGGNLELRGEPPLRHLLLHHELGHGTAADIAVAHKKYLCQMRSAS